MQTVSTSDITLHIRDEGPRDGRVVMFANSLGTDLRVWDALLPLLPPALRIIRYDKRGHGLSDATPAPYSIDKLVADAEAVCDGLGLRDITFVGLSIGGLITATIPPSLGLILYGFLGEVSIGRLFIAGIVPGVLLTIALMIATAWVSKKRDYKPVNDRLPTFAEVVAAVKTSFWAILFPVWLIVGIRFGLFTPSEAGAFAVAYAVIVGGLIYRELTWAAMVEALLLSVRDIGMIMIIILLSGAFGYVITFERVPSTLAELALGLFSSQTALLFTISGFLLVFGMLVEATVIVMLLTPILVPVITAAGIDPVHFGLVMMTLVTFGGMTPPVGVSMFTVCGILKCSYKDYTVEAMPLFAAVLAVVIIMILFPGLVMFLPDAMMGG